MGIQTFDTANVKRSFLHTIQMFNANYCRYIPMAWGKLFLGMPSRNSTSRVKKSWS